VTSYSSKPWLMHYRPETPFEIIPEYKTMLDLFEGSLERSPDGVAIKYFDGFLTMKDLNDQSNSLAVALQEKGFTKGDRLGIYVQNNPSFMIGLLAAWKAGGTAVAINPMNKARELSYQLQDSGSTVLLCLDDLYDGVAKDVINSGDSAVSLVITCSARDYQTRNDQRVLPVVMPTPREGTVDLNLLLENYSDRKPVSVDLSSDDAAVITYTSGTTGVPKGAINTHGSMAFNAQSYRDWIGITDQDVVLGVAPLFHITGLVGHIGLSLLASCPLVLNHRFHPEVVVEAIREHRPTFTIGAITVFLSLASVKGVTLEDFSSLRSVFSGGSPIAPAINQKLKEQLGFYIHNVYGLTETNSPTHMVPLGANAPVDLVSGALSVGVPIFNTVSRVLDEDGLELPIGEIGEIVVSGPQVIPGYWNKPEATAESLVGGELHTGDVGFMDEAGWFYIVDRKKDMINASGYKVWPREVEDVIYGHPAVQEVAVVGVPDQYRGETVKAYVSLKPDLSGVSTEDIIEFCKENMAAYKYPRLVEFVSELPKTATGKILRRELRDRT
jgi:long-chain acyl-CoA synthetase